MSAPNETLSDWLWRELHERDWTRADLARAVPIDPAQVTRWLKGTDRPSRHSAIRLSEIFGVHANFVLALAGHEPMPNHNINLSDPLVAFSLANAPKMSDRQKRRAVALLETLLDDEEG